MPPCCLAAGDEKENSGSRTPRWSADRFVRSLITTVGLDMTTDEDTAEERRSPSQDAKPRCLLGPLKVGDNGQRQEIFGNVVGERFPRAARSAPAGGRGGRQDTAAQRERERQGEEEAMDREDSVRGEPTTERGNQEPHTTLLVADEIGQVKGE